MWGDFSAILEGHAGMADSEGCERNPFARDVFRPKVAYLQNLSEIEKSFAHILFYLFIYLFVDSPKAGV